MFVLQFGLLFTAGIRLLPALPGGAGVPGDAGASVHDHRHRHRVHGRTAPGRAVGRAAIAFAGIALVGLNMNSPDRLAGFGLALAAAQAWSLANLVTKHMGGRWNPLALVAWCSLFSVPVLLGASRGCWSWKDRSSGTPLIFMHRLPLHVGDRRVDPVPGCGSRPSSVSPPGASSCGATRRAWWRPCPCWCRCSAWPGAPRCWGSLSPPGRPPRPSPGPGRLGPQPVGRRRKREGRVILQRVLQQDPIRGPRLSRAGGDQDDPGSGMNLGKLPEGQGRGWYKICSKWVARSSGGPHDPELPVLPLWDILCLNGIGLVLAGSLLPCWTRRPERSRRPGRILPPLADPYAETDRREAGQGRGRDRHLPATRDRPGRSVQSCRVSRGTATT